MKLFDIVQYCCGFSVPLLSRTTGYNASKIPCQDSHDFLGFCVYVYTDFVLKTVRKMLIEII